MGNLRYRVSFRFCSLLIMLILGIFIVAGCGGKAPGNGGQTGSKEDALEFYKGKIITFVVPYDTGGGYDFMARLIAPTLQKYIPGSTITISNVPGAGSLVGTNQVFLSKPDGLTIGILNTPGVIGSQATKAKGVKFDLTKFTWVGRIDTDPEVLVMRKDANITSVEQLQKSSGKYKFSLTGVGSAAFTSMNVFAKAADLKNVQLVNRYNGSNECVVAMLRGEVQGTTTVLSSLNPVFQANTAVPLAVVAKQRLPELPNIPIVTEVVNPENKDVMDSMVAMLEAGRSVVAPPGLDAGKAQVLREAFEKALKDPELLDRAKKAKRPIDLLSAEEELKLVQQSLNMPESLKLVIAVKK